MENKCKHSGTYLLISPSINTKIIMEWTQEEGFNNNLLKPLIESGLNYNELTYEELPDDQKEIIDIQWEEYSKYSSMRCSEHCGQRNEG